jgi:hypothetical protein
MLVGTLVGCEPVYYDRQNRSAYPSSGYGYGYGSGYGYYPSRNYNSRGDYYRHYNGIDG